MNQQQNKTNPPVRLWAEVADKMQAEADRRGLTFSRMVNFALTEWLKAQKLENHDAFEPKSDE